MGFKMDATNYGDALQVIERWKERYLRQRAARKAAEAQQRVTPVPEQITATAPIRAEQLNPNLYAANVLLAKAARLIGCAMEAQDIVLSKQPDVVFMQPMPMTPTAIILYAVKDLRPRSVIMDFADDVQLSDTRLVLSIMGELEKWLLVG